MEEKTVVNWKYIRFVSVFLSVPLILSALVLAYYSPDDFVIRATLTCPANSKECKDNSDELQKKIFDQINMSDEALLNKIRRFDAFLKPYSTILHYHFVVTNHTTGTYGTSSQEILRDDIEFTCPVDSAYLSSNAESIFMKYGGKITNEQLSLAQKFPLTSSLSDIPKNRAFIIHYLGNCNINLVITDFDKWSSQNETRTYNLEFNIETNPDLFSNFLMLYIINLLLLLALLPLLKQGGKFITKGFKSYFSED